MRPVQNAHRSLPVDKLQQGFDIVASQGDEAVGTSLRNSKQGHVRTDVIPPFGGRYSKVRPIEAIQMLNSAHCRALRWLHVWWLIRAYMTYVPLAITEIGQGLENLGP